MDDPLLMRRIKSIGDLRRDGDHVRAAEARVRERSARSLLDELEDQRGHAIRVLQVMNRRDVRMVERGYGRVPRARSAIAAPDPM